MSWVVMHSLPHFSPQSYELGSIPEPRCRLFFQIEINTLSGDVASTRRRKKKNVKYIYMGIEEEECTGKVEMCFIPQDKVKLACYALAVHEQSAGLACLRP